MYNILNLTKIAIAAAHNNPKLADELSTYYLALDIHGSWQGLVIAVTDSEFDSVYDNLTDKQFAQQLLKLGKRVNLKNNRKNVRGPQTPQPKRTSGNRVVGGRTT